MANIFKWRKFDQEIIILSVRWYLRYALSYRDIVELLAERGITISHTTVYRWVQKYAPILEISCRKYLKKSGADSTGDCNIIQYSANYWGMMNAATELFVSVQPYTRNLVVAHF